jgi:hypothetical protein
MTEIEAIQSIDSQRAQNILARSEMETDVPDKKGDVLYLVAAMMAQHYKILQESQPDSKAAENAQIEQGVANAVQQNSGYEGLVDFWKELQASLPDGASLTQFATSQYNLLTNDPGLIAAVKKVSDDNAAVKQSQADLDGVNGRIDVQLHTWYFWLLPVINAGVLAGLGIAKGVDTVTLGNAQNQLAADNGSVTAREQLLSKRSNNQAGLVAASDNQVINQATDASQAWQTALKQDGQLMQSMNFKG